MRHSPKQGQRTKVLAQNKKHISSSLDSRRDFLVASSGVVAASLLTSTANGFWVASRNEAVVECSAREMAKLLQSKELSPVELLEAHIARFAKIQSQVNAVTHTAFGAALRHARIAERAILTGNVDWNSRPIFGIPFSVKNHIDVVGIPTTAAVRDRLATEEAIS